jgi:hypothetical protein
MARLALLAVSLFALAACSESGSLAQSPTIAPSPPAPDTPHESLSIDTAAFTRPLAVDVYLPKGYDAAPDDYYSLVVAVGGDADGDIARLVAALEAQAKAGRMTPVILAVVLDDAGIGDLTPEPRDKDESGLPWRIVDWPAYHRFLREDLLRTLESRFRTNGRRTLIGAGDAGLFVLDAALANTWLFDDWIPVDPSLEHAAAHADKRARYSLKRNRNATANLVIAWSGDGGNAPLEQQLIEAIRANVGERVEWSTLVRSDQASAGAFPALAAEALMNLNPPPPPGEAMAAPSRPLYDSSCRWAPFASAELGLRLWVADCPGTSRYEFSMVEDRLEQHRPADDRIFGSHVALQMFRKPAEQPIEEALKEQFIATLPVPARDSCVVERIQRRGMSGAKQLFTLVPTGEYRDKIFAELQEYPRDFGCGAYGKTQGDTYFEYHPGESNTRFAFVVYGMDEPLFDEKSLRFGAE